MKAIPAVKTAMLALAICGAGFHAARADDKIPAELRAGMVEGYLKTDELPDSVALLPPPPALGTPAQANDEQVARETMALKGSDRFKLSAIDADLSFPNAAGTFSCAIGAPITEADTPTLYRLLHKALSDAGLATTAAKERYQHARPFMIDGEGACTPAQEKALRSSGSYPSGHASAGWAWALILAELAPDRADAILRRGRAFGDSRVVCNVHWASDVEEGRVVAAAVVARLHANDAFRADLAAARTELDAVRAKGSPPQRDCAFEKQTLDATPWLTR
jgi:acid phosphatase (class A)